MSKYQTEQERFWAGEFGDQYIDRNRDRTIIAGNLALFGKILQRTQSVRSAIEFGANIGLNLEALRLLVPGIALFAVEINAKAVGALEKLGGIVIHAQSMLDFQPQAQYDLVLIKGVLIHINPERLSEVYDRLRQSARRYICIVEYYNPTPVEVPYRGNRDRLFKRDFAGEMLDRFVDLRLVDYGFAYHRDPNFPQDDGNWFLLEKAAQ
ncbi:MAG: pseudaminic acid biosynthesis-associated methylase [bacterium]|uniref:Pseudaminic acid biosynthesis-associated methylase n=1 Tax=Candidatus Methylomirabilis tolerans TaxID=3123416 RepID=A0AAJ1AH33_9BACT|nr:pseudaminic acid biosynthesis-associated methylase [Candidatus Methylomirabilis sp.]